MHLAVAPSSSAGDHIVSSRSLYGGYAQPVGVHADRFGIETTFVDPRDLERFRSRDQPNTKLVFGEILGNPGLEVLNVPELGGACPRHGLPLLVDATFATPYLCRPIELGADS